MMNDDLQTRKVENLKVPNMDVAVPMQLKGPTTDQCKGMGEGGGLVRKGGGDDGVRVREKVVVVVVGGGDKTPRFKDKIMYSCY